MSSTRVNEAKEVGAKSSRLMSDATYKVTHPRDGDGHPNLQESGGFSVMVTRAHMIVSRVDQSPSRSSNLGKGIEPNNGAQSVQPDLGESMGSVKWVRQQRQKDYTLQQSRQLQEQLRKGYMQMNAPQEKPSAPELGEPQRNSSSLRVSMNFEYVLKFSDAPESLVSMKNDVGEGADLGESAGSDRVWHVRMPGMEPTTVNIGKRAMPEHQGTTAGHSALVGDKIGQYRMLSQGQDVGSSNVLSARSYEWICTGQCDDTPGCVSITNLAECQAAGASLGDWPDSTRITTVEQFAANAGFQLFGVETGAPTGCAKGISKSGLAAGEPFGVVTTVGSGTCAPSLLTGIAGCACKCTPGSSKVASNPFADSREVNQPSKLGTMQQLKHGSLANHSNSSLSRSSHPSADNTGQPENKGKATLTNGAIVTSKTQKVFDAEEQRQSKEVEAKGGFQQQTESMASSMGRQNKAHNANIQSHDMRVVEEKGEKQALWDQQAEQRASLVQDEKRAKSEAVKEAGKKTEHQDGWDLVNVQEQNKRVTLNQYKREQYVKKTKQEWQVRAQAAESKIDIKRDAKVRAKHVFSKVSA